MIAALIVLGVALILSIYNNKNYFFENKRLREENTELKLKLEKSEEEIDDIMSIDPGDKAIITNYAIIAFMQNKWVDKNRIDLIVDDSTRRDAKLKQLGIT